MSYDRTKKYEGETNMKIKICAVLHLICIALLIVGISLAIVGFKSELSILIAVSIALASISYLLMIITFLIMQYAMYCDGMVDLCVVFLKYWFTLFGGICIWGIVTAIKALKDDY